MMIIVALVDDEDVVDNGELGVYRVKTGTGVMLDELEAYELLETIDVPHAASSAMDANATQAPSLPFRYPVVVKALSSAIAHKSDVGGVILNVKDDTALLAAAQKIKQASGADRVLIQPMIAGLGEVLIGYRYDRDAGPTVMLAAGGILAEIHRDRSLRLAPVDLTEAHAMIAEVQKYVPGYRLKNGPVFDGNRVSIYLEVEGLGDYLPKYAGNLDIMTAAGLRTAEMIAEEIAAGRFVPTAA